MLAWFGPGYDKHTLIRVLKLQKRAARVILDANRQANSVKLFNKLNWIPFSEQAKLTKCCIIYKRLQGHVPTYLKSLLKLTSEIHSRKTRYANFNIVCPVVKRQTEGGRTFTVTACQAWNSLPLSVRKLPTIKSFSNSLWKRIFKEQRLSFKSFYSVIWVHFLFVILSHSLSIVLIFVF